MSNIRNTIFRIRIPEKGSWLYLLCWLLFIGYDVGMVLMTRQTFSPLYQYIIFYTVNISLFYAHVRVLDYTFKPTRRAYRAGAALFLAVFASFQMVKAMVDFSLAGGPLSTRLQTVKLYLPANFARNCYFVMFATFYWVGGNIAAFRRKAAEAEQAELETQMKNAELQTRWAESRNAYLQQQVNPHMLFNALSFIHTQVYKSSPDAAHCVWLLSDIMRFSLDSAEADGKTSLEKEAEQLGHLLEINRFRFEGAFYIDVEMRGNFENYRIIPLVLMTLAENVFKHGDLRQAENPASLSLEADHTGRLTFLTRNLKKTGTATPRSRALGLQNTRLRLDFAYPGKYALDIKEHGDWHQLSLKINLC